MHCREKGLKPLTVSLLRLLGGALILLSCYGLLAACGPPGASGTSLESGGAAPVLVVSDALAELEAMDPPPDVEPALFEQLRQALSTKLVERGEKIVGTPPEGPANAVGNLSAAGFADGQLTLAWSYINVGDYNQDGVVGIADLTPLAVHFGESTEYSSAAIPVDGNNDTFINVADITPLAAHFFASCSGYVVQGKVPDLGTYDDLATVNLPPPPEEGRTRVEATVELCDYRYFRVIPIDGEANRGEPSDVLYYDIHPPHIVGLNRTGGVTGEEVQFSPTVSGARPMSFEWDFGGRAEPNNPIDEEPTVLLGAVGDCQATLTAVNVFGEDVYEFTLTVTAEPPEPPEITSVEPAEVVQDRLEQFTATVNGDPPFTYDWEFGETANPPSSSEASPQVSFSVVQPVDASLTVTNPAGSDTLEFEITVYPPGDPPLITAVEPTEGEAGQAGVEFHATLSGTPPFHFSWDFDGGADPSTSDEQFPQVTLQTEAEYDASVTASSIYGTHTFPFKLRVNPPSGEPPEITDVQPRSGATGTEVTFTATVSGDEPMSYQWDFDDGATPNKPTEASPTVTLGAPGTYEDATLQVDNAFGSDTFQFRLTVTEVPEPGVMVVVDDAGNVGKYTSLAVIDGHPAIAYSDNSTAVTKYIRADDAMGTAWSMTPVTIDPSEGGWTFLTTVSERPAVSYEGGDQDLYYARAKDATGSQWNAPQPIVTEGWVPRQNSILIVEDCPAINYVNVLGCDLYYVHAKDADGASWNDPVHVDGTPEDRGTFSWMALVKGSPAISYNDLSDDVVRYIRATNPTGTSWGDSVIIDATGEAWYTHLVVASGNPAVAYRHQGQSRLKYVRALDDAGSTWGAPVTLDDQGSCGDWLSLAIINGRPAVSYLYGETSDLRYVVAKDAEGSEWYSPIAIDTEGIVGYHTSLALVNGRPAISYYDSTNGDLKYVIANDAYGLDWPSAGG